MKNYNPKKSHSKRKAIAVLRAPSGYTRYFYNQTELSAYLAKQGVENVDDFTDSEQAVEIAASNIEPLSSAGEKGIEQAKTDAVEDIQDHLDAWDKFEHADGFRYVAKIKEGGTTRYFYSVDEYRKYVERKARRNKLKNDVKNAFTPAKTKVERKVELVKRAKQHNASVIKDHKQSRDSGKKIANKLLNDRTVINTAKAKKSIKSGKKIANKLVTNGSVDKMARRQSGIIQPKIEKNGVHTYTKAQAETLERLHKERHW